jgi:hypothetical protein
MLTKAERVIRRARLDMKKAAKEVKRERRALKARVAAMDSETFVSRFSLKLCAECGAAGASVIREDGALVCYDCKGGAA